MESMNSQAGSAATPVVLEEGSYDESEQLRLQISTSQNVVVIFSCTSKYHWLVILVLVTSFFSLPSVIPPWIDPTYPLPDKWIFMFFGAISFLLLMVVYLTLLPVRLEVRARGADVSVVVVTLLYPHVFTQVVRAYQVEGIFSESTLPRPRVSFSTDSGPRIVVERQPPGWNLVVTPSDPGGFLQAVHDATAGQQLEALK